jgi:PAS domain-containing protein
MRTADQTFYHVFGEGHEPIHAVERRAELAFGPARYILWEGDPETFRFLYVSKSTELILGYPASAWTNNATFWADTIVHPEDRRDAIAYCALATGKGRDHDFVYRAVRSDGSIVWLHDVVKVIPGLNRVPTKLRGVMFPVVSSTAVVPVFERVTEQTHAVA